MRYFVFFLLLFPFQGLLGQAKAGIPKVVLAKQDNELLQVQELALRSHNRTPEFAVQIEALIQPNTHGLWQEQAGGRSTWQLQIESSNAYSLNFGFTQFHLPADAVLLIYPPNKSKIYGPFTAADNEAHESLWTPIMLGDALVIEVNLPSSEKTNLQLQLQYINHDFMGFTRLVSGTCNLDVACSSADGWPQLDQYRDLMQSVGMISIDGRKLCTGFLINNGRADCTPYFITANHCGISRADARSMVVYWNYQNSYCRAPNNSQSGRPGDGILDTYNTGAIYLASSEKSDFVLLRLDDPVVEEAHAFFAGWNVTATLPTTGVFSIHHPLTEEKRVAISEEAPFLGKWNANDQIFPDGDHLIVPRWTQGTTEEGSSGAPLFNKDKQVIGQLHGGRADCNNDSFDAFGWLSTSWTEGSTASSRLQDWLDPDQVGMESLSGRWAIQCDLALVADLARQQVCRPATGAFKLTVSDAFAQPVELALAYAPNDLGLVLKDLVIAPGANTQLTYQINPNTAAGTYPIVVRASDGRDTVYADLELQVQRPPIDFDLTVPSKSNLEVNGTIVLQWFGSPNSINYKVTIAEDAAFTQIYDQQLTSDTFLVYDSLAFASNYFWKVNAYNNCGQGTSSTGQFRTSPDIRLKVLQQPAATCAVKQVDFRIQLGDGFQNLKALKAQLVPPIDHINIIFDQDPQQLAAGAQIGIQIQSAVVLPIGSYQLLVQAQDVLRQGTVEIPFEIFGAPAPADLIQPLENWVELTKDVHFQWEASETSHPFMLEIASDLAFQKKIQEQEILGNNAHLQLPAGNYYWRVRNNNNCGITYSKERRLRLLHHDQSQLNGTQIFIEPTPSNGALRIRFSEILEKAHLQVLNLQGQVLLEQPIPENYTVPLDLQRYPKGVYLVRIKARRSSITKKVIIQ
jgi:hypothetical protein